MTVTSFSRVADGLWATPNGWRVERLSALGPWRVVSPEGTVTGRWADLDLAMSAVIKAGEA